MKRKGLIAILDGLQAYIVAFIAIGLIVMIMTNSQEADAKSSYTLNIWAEDIADVVGRSTDWNIASMTSEIEGRLETSLDAISDSRGIAVSIDVGSTNIDVGNVDTRKEIATATRFLVDGDHLTTLTVKVGL